MKTKKTTTAFALIAALFFIISPFDSANAAEALSVQDHLKIAEHHEALLKEAETKLKEHQSALENYESRPYYYGRMGQELEFHETANIREYEKVIAENRAKAELHYKLAAESQAQKFMTGSISSTQTN